MSKSEIRSLFAYLIRIGMQHCIKMIRKLILINRKGKKEYVEGSLIPLECGMLCAFDIPFLVLKF